ncbi:acetyl-CoA carboxylase biotin carboxyl carrier protein [Asanoa iriomotensis]|uniref:Biotin carboxyl carrier protein of acetyl-CoA carboxylase n=1 Tax=Asanoa iriomotensis TaxID=234613 RepID=A0ABQ4C0U9_9ACTN|nr:acetyl-CoA carboxylase biotin carboxyl carrier protein subunit [Asanoa iriomotensis]GIF56404.1 hypothetical protein Air01nite_24990 [Asanoa iriomotensis]
MTDAEHLLAALTDHLVRLGRASTFPLTQVKIQAGDVALEVVWDPAGANGHAAAPVSAPAAVAPPEDPESTLPDGSFTVCAPTVGVLYAAPEPGAPPFVQLGDIVSEGQQLAILEAMKLMNPIDADRPGRVARILVPDAAPVEYGQALFVLEPC